MINSALNNLIGNAKIVLSPYDLSCLFLGDYSSSAVEGEHVSASSVCRGSCVRCNKYLRVIFPESTLVEAKGTKRKKTVGAIPSSPGLKKEEHTLCCAASPL